MKKKRIGSVITLLDDGPRPHPLSSFQPLEKARHRMVVAVVSDGDGEVSGRGGSGWCGASVVLM